MPMMQKEPGSSLRPSPRFRNIELQLKVTKNEVSTIQI